MPSEPLPDEPTYACKICGRRFIKSSLEKHVSACKKLASLNRKPFDSGKQRAHGSDITYDDVKRAQKEKIKMGGVFPRPQTNWKERHETFIDAVSSSKKVDYAIKTGAPLPPPPRTAVPSDYVQCEYCGRNFNEYAAERHIPFCRDQNTRRGGVPKTPGANVTSSSYRGLPSKQDVQNRMSTSTRSRTDSHSNERSSVSRSREGSLTRGRVETAQDLNARRRSLDTRTRNTSAQVAARNTSLSAGQRQGTLPPTTPNKRSTSAPRTPGQQRLKTPSRPKSIWRAKDGYTSYTSGRDDYFSNRESRKNNSRSQTNSNSYF